MKNPPLNSSNAEAVRKAQVSRIPVFLTATLPGIVETVLWLAEQRRTNPTFAFDELRACFAGIPEFRNAVSVWNGNGNASIGQHSAPSREFFRIASSSDLTDTGRFTLFNQRYCRSLQENGGFCKEFAYALAGVFAEMSDNIVQHSGLESGRLTGLVGFHVAPGYAAFTVGDVGCGLLASLKQSAQWSALSSVEDAIMAIVRSGASRRQLQGEGEGFRQLFRSLSDRNAQIRFRSEDAVVTLSDATDHRPAARVKSHPLSGFQISISCSARGTPEEKIFENI